MQIGEMVSGNIERLLGGLGLEKRRSAASFVLPAVGVFAAGALVGGVLGLLFAPSSGRKLRAQIGHQLRPSSTKQNDIVHPETREPPSTGVRPTART